MHRGICRGQRLDPGVTKWEPTRHAVRVSIEEAVDVRREILHSASCLGEELERSYRVDPRARYFPYRCTFPQVLVEPIGLVYHRRVK
jgi:hypothetical protein